MGGIGSGRKPKREKVSDIKKEKEQDKPEKKSEPKGRLYSVPNHVSRVKTSGGCRFHG